MANDSHLFKKNQAERLLPLYGAKMFHIYSHHFASAEAPKTEKGFGGSSGKFTEEDLLNSSLLVKSRYFVSISDIDNKICPLKST
jgi:hypothetical protein